MPLPASGIISGSQVGVYVFDRGATDEFSLSASLASPGNSTKEYATNIGPLWRGTGVSDINNPQYDEGSENWSISDWYGYWKGMKATITDIHRPDDPEGACDDFAEFNIIYHTDGRYYNGGAGTDQDVYNNSTVVYTNGEGTDTFDVQSDHYFKIFEVNAAYSTDNNGVLINEYIC